MTMNSHNNQILKQIFQEQETERKAIQPVPQAPVPNQPVPQPLVLPFPKQTKSEQIFAWFKSLQGHYLEEIKKFSTLPLCEMKQRLSLLKFEENKVVQSLGNNLGGNYLTLLQLFNQSIKEKAEKQDRIRGARYSWLFANIGTLGVALVATFYQDEPCEVEPDNVGPDQTGNKIALWIPLMVNLVAWAGYQVYQRCRRN